MKLSEVLPLLEARSHANINKTISTYEQLLKYKDNPNIFISFTEINKIGINPSSPYDTPLGIYCYPLQKIWQHYKIDIKKSLDSLPFQSHTKYIQVLEWNGNGNFIKDLATTYNDSDLRKDIKSIKDLYPDKIFNADITDIDELNKTINTAIARALADSAASKFFNVCKNVTSALSTPITKRVDDKSFFPDIKEVTPSQSARNWNALLRKLGYAGMADLSGRGIIHTNEPIQAFFTSTEFFNHVDTVINKNVYDIDEDEIQEFINDNNIDMLVTKFKHLKNRKDIALKYKNFFKMDITKGSSESFKLLKQIFGVTIDEFESFKRAALRDSYFSNNMNQYASQGFIKPSVDNFNIIVRSLYVHNVDRENFLSSILNLIYDRKGKTSSFFKKTIWYQYAMESSLISAEIKHILNTVELGDYDPTSKRPFKTWFVDGLRLDVWVNKYATK
jgi:hypothetical protein